MHTQHGVEGLSTKLVLLGKYLRDPGNRAADSLGLAALLNAILEYALYTEQPGLKHFGDDLKALAGHLEDRTSAEQTEPVVRATAGLLAEHRKAKDELDRKEVQEIHEMLVMFNRSMAALTEGSKRSVERLTAIETDLNQASGLNDLAALRGRMGSVLEFVQRERESERARTLQVVEMLESDFRRVQSTLLECGVGMPGREQAIAALKRTWNEQAVAAMVRLDQMAQVSERHGSETAQRMIAALLDSISKRLGLPCATFAWRRDALFLLAEHTVNQEQARRQIRQRAAEIPAAYLIEAASRKTLFRCPHRWFVLGSDEERDYARAIARFEQFLEAQ
jgi:hypothetical protein